MLSRRRAPATKLFYTRHRHPDTAERCVSARSFVRTNLLVHLFVRSLVPAALAEAASDAAPEADDVTVFDPAAREKETLAKAVAADLKAVG